MVITLVFPRTLYIKNIDGYLTLRLTSIQSSNSSSLGLWVTCISSHIKLVKATLMEIRITSRHFWRQQQRQQEGFKCDSNISYHKCGIIQSCCLKSILMHQIRVDGLRMLVLHWGFVPVSELYNLCKLHMIYVHDCFDDYVVSLKEWNQKNNLELSCRK